MNTPLLYYSKKKKKVAKNSFPRHYKNQILMVQIVDFIGDWGGRGG